MMNVNARKLISIVLIFVLIFCNYTIGYLLRPSSKTREETIPEDEFIEETPVIDSYDLSKSGRSSRGGTMGDYRYEFYLQEEFVGAPTDQQHYWFVGINVTSNYEIYRWDSTNTVWNLVYTGAVNPGEIRLFIGEPFGTVYRILSTGPLYLVVTSSEGSFMNLADSNTGSGKGTDFVFIGDIEMRLGVNKLAVFAVEEGGTNVSVEYYNFSNGAIIGTDFAGPLQKGDYAFFEFHSVMLGVSTVLVRVTSDKPIISYKCTIDDDEIDIAISEEGNRTGQTFYFPLVHIEGFAPIFHVYNKEDFPVSAELYDITSGSAVYLGGVSDIPPRSMGAFTASFTGGDKAFKLNATGNVGVLFGAGFPSEHEQYDSDGIGGGGGGPGRIDSYWEYPPLNNRSTLYKIPVLYGNNDMPLDCRFQFLCSGSETTSIFISPPLAFLSPTVLVNEFEYISTTNNSLSIRSSGSGIITGLRATLDGAPWGIDSNNIELPAGQHTLQLSATMSGQAFIGIDTINMARRSTLVWRLLNITTNETIDFGHASIYGELQWTYESDRPFAFYAGGSGNCWLTNIEMVQVPELTRNITLDPPHLYDRVAENGEDVVLNWIDPNDPYDIAYYLIYSAPTQTSFDFSGPPLYNTSMDPNPKRSFWTDVGVASLIGERYYVVRAVSRYGTKSTTSNTVGKWTKDFGDILFPPPSYTSVSSEASERSVVSGTITDIFNMQDWDDNGASGILKEGAVPGSENVIFNGEFDGDIEGWERNIIIGDKSGSSSYDSGANAPGGTGGSMVGSASNLFGPVEFMEYRSQVLNTVITSTDKVILSLWWKKDFSGLGVDEQRIYVEIEKPSGGTVILWEDPFVMDDNIWYYFESDVSFLFDETGIYEIRLGWSFSGYNVAHISAWFDEVVLNVTGAFTKVYKMDIAINNTVPNGSDGYDLEILGKTTNEPFKVQIWNGTDWNDIGEISSVTKTMLIRHRILPDEMTSGKITVRYPDTDWLFDNFQDILYIDYQRVVSWTKRTTTFSLPLEPFDTSSVDWYADSIPYTCYIRWTNGGASSEGCWVRHDWDMGFGVNDTPVFIGKSYEIACGGGNFTFVGSPAANIRYTEGHLPAPGNFALTVDQSTGVVNLMWDPVSSLELDRYLIYKTTTRMELNDITIPYYAFTNSTIWEDPMPVSNDTKYYYSVVAVKSNMSVGFNTTYSLGVWTRNYKQHYDTLALPLKINATYSIDWYCDEIPNTWGINYHTYSNQRWQWHKAIMPKGAYDIDMILAEGYQISTTGATKYSFVGV